MTAETTGRNGEAVSLEQMLEARDKRAARQQAALTRFALPVVSSGVVMPGPVKDNAQSRIAMAAAREALEALFAARDWPVRLFEPVRGPTGPESIHVIDADALEIKRALAKLEDTHPLGRLWDLDVICPERGIISRRSLGQPPRRCLLCEAEAHACARSRRHSLEELLTAIEKMTGAYSATGP
ncbi:citrate lyase holo-[acyl-carrier protein] synthase [Telmatospirillum siberiense]|uniref:citrate lyase holo-[acyl-carrier protein] synthase n=1 Tax=Telmatospirillum siberiense TaxID=382514 RepID=A0A2N3Q0Q7_9PROT|nr:citrate lyase holo-[acyl-carrier protein] synthase [Telmatospirillum siberiense]PKU26240.1 citrate lyase holo-[acyl-carrier protein] synthase [Telmatospirillum siberiense]